MKKVIQCLILFTTIISLCAILFACNNKIEPLVDDMGNINHEQIEKLPKQEVSEEEWAKALSFEDIEKVKVTNFTSVNNIEKRLFEFKFDKNLIEKTIFLTEDKFQKHLFDLDKNLHFEFLDGLWTKHELDLKIKEGLSLESFFAVDGLGSHILSKKQFDYENGKYTSTLEIEKATITVKYKFVDNKVTLFSFDHCVKQFSVKTLFIFEYDNIDVIVPDVK